MKRKWIGVTILTTLLVLVGVGIVASLAGAGSLAAIGSHESDKTATFDQTLDVAGRPTLAVTSRTGSVTVTRGADRRVVVHATKRAPTQGRLDELGVDLRRDGDRVTIATTGDRWGGWMWFGSGGPRVDYEIQMPAQSDLDPLRNTNGTITISGITGRLDLESSNGTIRATDFDGPLRAQTSNGVVTIRDGRGTLDLRSSNGTVDVQNVQAHALAAQTSNGRVTFTGTLATGSHNRVDVGNGSVALTLPPDSGLGIDLRAGNGSVNVGFTVNTAVPGGESSKNAVKGVINGKTETTLDVHAGNGSITLSPGGSAPSVPATPAAPQSPARPATPAAAAPTTPLREGGIA